MKTTRYKNLLVLLLIATVLTTVSCKEDEKPEMIDIALNKSTLTLVLGDTETLMVSPDLANVVWTSSNTDVVTVTDGVITTVGLGDATVNAKISNSRAFCDVSVIEEPVNVTGVSVTKSETLLAVGRSEILEAVVSPADATYKNIKWSSSNPDIVFVDYLTGEITAKAVGEATITATTTEGGKTALCLVKVWPALLLSRPFNNIPFILDPTDPAKKIFSWIPLQGISEYVLKISQTEDFQSALFEMIVSGSSTEVTAYELNEQIKNLAGRTIKVYWTVQPKDPVNAISEIRTLDVMPDRHEYLRLLPESATNMTVSKNAGEFQYSLSAGASGGSVNTSALTSALHPDSIMFSIMYKSASEIPAMEIFFVKAGGTEAGSITTTAIPSSANWKEFAISLKQAVANFSWGSIGDYLRLDFGNSSQAEVNAIHFRAMNYQEIKENYVPQIFTITSTNQMTLERVTDYHFKVLTTGTDPNCRTANLAATLPSGAVMLTFEYKSTKQCLNHLQIYFATPALGLNETRSIKPLTLGPAAEWTVYQVDMTNARKDFSWGVTGSYVRLDFGNLANYDIEFRNIKVVYKD